MKQFFPNIRLLLVLLSFSACREEVDTVSQSKDSLNLSQQVYTYMHEWYLWNEDIPAIDTTGLYQQGSLDTAVALMNTLRKKENPTDRWSYIEKSSTYNEYFNKGQYEGYGLRMGVDADNQLRVAYVFTDAPFYRAGVGRSWIIKAINGKSAVGLLEDNTLSQELENSTNTFDFVDPQGNTSTQSITKSKVGINSVLYKNVYEVDGKKVGYLVFNNFLATSIPELRQAFQFFEQQDIADLILDLRYNGGGRVNIAQYIASNLLGSKGAGQPFVKFLYNNRQSAENETILFIKPEYTFNLNRLLVIASDGTASSSELVINGLKPFMDVILIGNHTYGKPVGSRPDTYGEYTVSLINFKTVNQLDQGDYYEGLPADALVPDDLTRDFGNPEERRLKEALYYIANGSFSGEIARYGIPDKKITIPLTGFRQEIGTY